MDDTAVRKNHSVIVGVESGDACLDPVNLVRQDGRHRARSRLRSEYAPAYHRPARLVVMRVSGVDYRDVESLVAREETGRCGDACGTGADDDDVVARRRSVYSECHVFLH